MGENGIAPSAYFPVQIRGTFLIIFFLQNLYRLYFVTANNCGEILGVFLG